MKNKRIKLSGAAYQKAAKEKQKKKEELLQKIPKLNCFFTTKITASTELNPTTVVRGECSQSLAVDVSKIETPLSTANAIEVFYDKTAYQEMYRCMNMLQSCFKMTSVNNAKRLVYVLASRAYSRKSRRNREIRGEELLEQEDELVMKIEDSEFRTNPNWQLIPRHKDSQFKLPNNVGIAPEDCIITTRLNYYTQDCPILLKSEITDRFNVPHMKNVNICMITISLKQTSNTDISNLTKQYLHAAFGISDRLHSAGYWADFIHPYTGLPALNPGLNVDFSTLELPYKHTVYQVNTRRKCKVIMEKVSPNTIGNIFTNALPSKTDVIDDVLEEVGDLHQNNYD